MIFRLARLQIRSHRMRTAFIAVAVILTAVLYMTVISIAYCLMDSIQLSKMLVAGSDFHATIFNTGYSISGKNLRENIQNAPEVSDTFLVSFAPVHWEEPAEANRHLILSVRRRRRDCGAFLSNVDQNITDRAGKTWRVK